MRSSYSFAGPAATKSTQIESADQVARGIERAAKILGPERVRYVHPDCGFWMLKRSIADGKIRADKHLPAIASMLQIPAAGSVSTVVALMGLLRSVWCEIQVRSRGDSRLR